MSSPARLSIQHFFASFLVFSFVGFINVYYKVCAVGVNVCIFSFTGLALFILISSWFKYNGLEIAWRAALLGAIFSLGIYVYMATPPHVRIFGFYMSVMALFHFSEFVTIAIIQPTKVSTDSFVINHSPQYTVAAIASWLEFFIEGYFYPGLKQLSYVSYFGLAMCIASDFLRKLAMFTAGQNFNHLVQSEKARDHVLVTSGIYSLFRHPSYVGWFYWAIGTQLILVNPFCILAYATVSWMFFKSRIFIEEITLLNFFGQNYVDYQKKVGTGIPYIKGYQM